MENLTTYWFAIKSQKHFEAEKALALECDEVFLPTETIRQTTGGTRVRAVIPHVLFIKTTPDKALELEARSRDINDKMTPFWIYRFTKGDKIQKISDEEIRLLSLLTSSDSTKCEIYNKTDFQRGQLVRITGGPFAGNIGHVRRIKKDKHVIVEIKGICAIMLPFIHPDLLEAIPEDHLL